MPTAVLAAPVIPGLTDQELERILAAAREAGAATAGYVLLRLPLEIADLFTEWLETHRPERAARVLNLVRQTRGGRLYRSGFGERMRGAGPYAELLRNRFALASRRLGFDGRPAALDTASFRKPEAAGGQMALF